jgi:hypothetical protein
MYSCKNPDSRTLATGALDEFLIDFANRRFEKGPSSKEANPWFVRYEPFLPREVQTSGDQLQTYQTDVCLAWQAPDRWTREYYLARARIKLYEGIVKQVRDELGPNWVGISGAVPGGLASGLPQVTPLPDPFGRVLDRISDLGLRERLAICRNGGCITPYFIAQRKTQRYCSEKCAGTFQQEHKRRWWREHGNEWRKRKEKAKRGKKG